MDRGLQTKTGDFGVFGPGRRFAHTEPLDDGMRRLMTMTISTKDIAELRARTGAGRRLLALATLGAGLVVRRRDAELQLDAPHALEGALDHRALRRHEVAHDAERGEHDDDERENLQTSYREFLKRKAAGHAVVTDKRRK